MATLLSSAGNGDGTGAALSAASTVYVSGTFDGATVVVQISSDDVTYVKVDNSASGNTGRFTTAGSCRVPADGTYYLRCVVSGGGDNVSINAVTT